MSGGSKAVTKDKPGAQLITELNPSVGGLSKGNFPPENKYGTKTMRGGGAATKGTKWRGPAG